MTGDRVDDDLDDHHPDLEATGQRIEALLDASSAHGAVARERAEELVRLVSDLYGAGLERVLDLAHERGLLEGDLLESLIDDELVSGLLLVHGLHPLGVEERVERALEGVRPYLGSHGGDVELLGVSDDGVVRLRLLGSCDGCPSSSVTLKLAVEGAVEEAAPEVVGIEVEEPASSVEPGGVIPVSSLFARLGESGAGDTGTWVDVPALAELAPGRTVLVTAGALPVLGARIGAEVFAFRDGCPRCASSLAGAALARRMAGAAGDALLRCPGCAAHFDVRRAGACVEDPQLHLDPLPLLAEAGSVSVAVPVAEGVA